jgi:hypothetical protein
MYIDKVPNWKSRPTTLLRSDRREGGKVRLQTLSNIYHWPKAKIEALTASKPH